MRLRNNSQKHAAERGADEPAPTLFFGGRLNAVVWLKERQPNGAKREREREPAMTITGSADNGNFRWVYERPPTTVCADPRIGHPGHKDRENGEAQFEEESVAITLEEAAILQSFPPDFPWRGSRSKQFEQCGNAIPVLLARRLLEQFVGGPE